MNRDQMLALLSELISCHSPSGDEGEIEVVIRREFEKSSAKVWQDSATNLYAHWPGDGPKLMICAHKDEIGMVVTEVLRDGRLKVQNCGGSHPWKYGEGPVDILGDNGQIVRAILSVGSVHTRTGPVAELFQNRALTWDMVTLFSGLYPDELAARGVHVGSRAVVARERKQVQRLGEYIASYALDDRMGLVSLVAALNELKGQQLPLDFYFVATTGEEVGFLGAIRAAQTLQPEICIALDTSPVAHGTPLVLDARPVIWYAEAAFNNKADSDILLQVATELGIGAQPVIYNAAGSDAGGIKRAGLAGRTVAFGYARDNSHGYEIAHVESLVNVTRLLLAYINHLAAAKS
jgi:putative aminopeptidase FrvX